MSEKEGVATTPPAYVAHDEKLPAGEQEPVAATARRASVALNLVENPLKVRYSFELPFKPFTLTFFPFTALHP